MSKRSTQRKLTNRFGIDMQPLETYHGVRHHLHDTARIVMRSFAVQDIPSRNHIMQRARFLNAVDEKRERLLLQLLQKQGRRRWVIQRKWAWQFATVLIVFMMMFFPVRGQMTVAAKDSLPGDALYLVKLATEDTAVEVIDEADVKALLTLSFVDKRIDEIVQLAEGGREIPLNALYRTHRLLNTALSHAAWATEDDMVLVLDEIDQHIQSYVHILETVDTGNNATNRSRLADMRGRCLRLQLIVTAASMEPEVFQAAYRAGTPEELTVLSDPLGNG